MNKCPKCNSKYVQKNGSVKGKPKRRCKNCCYQFTQDKLQGVCAATKKLALHMYLEGLGFRAIGRLLGVSNVAVLNWVKQAALTIHQIHQQHRQIKTTREY